MNTKLTIGLEARFSKTPDQKIWTEDGPGYSFWQRYLDVFESVEVLARVQDISDVSPRWNRADGERVRFISLPYYIGPYQYLRNAMKIDKITMAVVQKADAVILRTPGQISNRLFYYLRKNSHPYGVEVVGDPYDVFAPGAVRHPLRPFFRWSGKRQLQEQCRWALGAAYVTGNALQRRYPNDLYSTHYSSIDIGTDAYAAYPKTQFGAAGLFRLVFVGSLAQLYKGPDILIDALTQYLSTGHSGVKLIMIGEGQFRTALEEQVARRGMNDIVTFLGQLPSGEAVRKELLQADLFVLPSRTEGLPRAMIEAMACGLPCIGTNVGGIPELLAPEDLVAPGDARELAAKIKEVLSNPLRLSSMSTRNLERAKDFRADILNQRRRNFYQYLRAKTELWMEKKIIL